MDVVIDDADGMELAHQVHLPLLGVFDFASDTSYVVSREDRQRLVLFVQWKHPVVLSRQLYLLNLDGSRWS